ncbi:hypothetical protein Pint_31189 [Pistacia integerrima]|uniref:Uncharacterized protein n=1 Tax=Pistacia integerrima TaxID=434235 RepID=A0ACC0XMA9_9ROSI|nr:hypothetical protein Pint_31189 [Pistacia integerrima]
MNGVEAHCWKERIIEDPIRQGGSSIKRSSSWADLPQELLEIISKTRAKKYCHFFDIATRMKYKTKLPRCICNFEFCLGDIKSNSLACPVLLTLFCTSRDNNCRGRRISDIVVFDGWIYVVDSACQIGIFNLRSCDLR